MPRFKVCVQRYVEETAVITIEADTPENAMEKGQRMLDGDPGYGFASGDIDYWQSGDDIINEEVYAVLDENGDIVWER